MTTSPVEIHFAADHPTAPGHFPGYPIIPGALLLDEVVRVVCGDAEHQTIAIRSAKFFHPVCPGQIMRVNWHRLNDGAVKFECCLAIENTTVASGIIDMALVAA